LQRDRKNAQALTQIAQAYRTKGLYDQAIEAARAAVQLKPTYSEPHLWMADSLRISGNLAEAAREYDRYLKLQDFDSHLAGKLNKWVIGFTIGVGGSLGRGKKAAQHDIWQEMHSHAYLGLCDTERLMKHYPSAIVYCQKALNYDPKDPYSHYTL